MRIEMEPEQIQGQDWDKASDSSVISEIFERNPQHTETFAFFFSQVFVMDLMGTPDRFEVAALGLAEPFDALMDEHIMHQKISESVERNA